MTALGRLSVVSLFSFLICAALPGFASATCADIDPLFVLPADDDCPGWTRDGEPMTAYTIEELMLIIDGEAFLYAQYGFVAAAFQNYAGEVQGEPVVITLSAFNQGTPENAEALYLDPNSGGGDPVTDWPGTGAARIEANFGFVRLQFWEECFFVSVLATSGGDAAVPAVRCLGIQVVALIQGPSPTESGTWGRVKSLYR